MQPLTPPCDGINQVFFFTTSLLIAKNESKRVKIGSFYSVGVGFSDL